MTGRVGIVEKVLAVRAISIAGNHSSAYSAR